MEEELKELKEIPCNKCVVFYSPVEGEDVFVRTGTISDSQKFLHSIFHAYSSEYVGLGEIKRSKFIQKFKNNILKQIDTSDWENSNDCIITIKNTIIEIFKSFYEYIINKNLDLEKSHLKILNDILHNKDNSTKKLKIIMKVINYNEMCYEIIEKAYDKIYDNDIDLFCKEVYNNILNCVTNSSLLKKSSIEKKRRFIYEVQTLFKNIFDIAFTISFEKYMNNLNDNDIETNSNYLDVISSNIKRNIYFINCKTRLPYKVLKKEQMKYDKSIIVIRLENGYEVAGILLNGNKIKRDFTKEDKIIKIIDNFVYEPESIKNNYPELLQFLDKKYRKNISFSPSYKRSPEKSPEGFGIIENSDYDEESSSTDYNSEDSDFDF